MGEEWGATTPFYYFTDFGGGLAQSVKRGRRREYESFHDFDATTMPDPEAETTFARSRLDWQEAETPEARGRRAFIGELLALRARRIQPLLEDAPGGRGRFARVGAHGLEVRWELGALRELVLLAQLGPEPGRGFVRPEGEELWLSTPHVQRELAQNRLPPWSVAWFLTEAPNP
jgi:1,4-alpha-glucan branching enzyme